MTAVLGRQLVDAGHQEIPLPVRWVLPAGRGLVVVVQPGGLGGGGADGRATTTVAMDFGRISFQSQLVLYLFGTPGQERFWFMWDDLAVGAIGAVIMADTRRIADCFASVDYFERNGTPFIVAVNCFDGAPRFEPEDIRIALTLNPEVPIVMCDARNRDSVKKVLVSLVRYVMNSRSRPSQAALG